MLFSVHHGHLTQTIGVCELHRLQFDLSDIPPEDCIPAGRLNRGQFKAKILARLTVLDTAKLSIVHKKKILASLQLDYLDLVSSKVFTEEGFSSSDTA